MNTINANGDNQFTYTRVGHIPDHPTNGNLLWHFNCLGWYTGEKNSDGSLIYKFIGYEEYNGFVISAPTLMDAIRVACEQIDISLCRDVHWTIELVGTTLHTYTKAVVLRSHTGS